MIVTLAQLRLHLRIDGDDENSLISGYAEAAEAQVRDWIGRPFYQSSSDLPAPDAPGYDPHQIVADQRIIVAILMLVDRMYNHRGGEGGSEDAATPPRTVRDVLSGHRLFCAVDPAAEGAAP